MTDCAIDRRSGVLPPDVIVRLNMLLGAETMMSLAAVYIASVGM